MASIVNVPQAPDFWDYASQAGNDLATKLEERRKKQEALARTQAIMGMLKQNNPMYDTSVSINPQGEASYSMSPQTLNPSQMFKQGLIERYNAGDNSPEVLKGLGMYVAPPKAPTQPTLIQRKNAAEDIIKEYGKAYKEPFWSRFIPGIQNPTVRNAEEALKGFNEQILNPSQMANVAPQVQQSNQMPQYDPKTEQVIRNKKTGEIRVVPK